MADIERLYHETLAQNQNMGGPPRAEATPGATNEQMEDPSNSIGPSGEIVDAETSKAPSDGNQSSLLSLNSGRTGQSIDQALKQTAPADAKQGAGKDPTKKNSQRGSNPQSSANQGASSSRANQKNQRQGNQAPQTLFNVIKGDNEAQPPVLKSMTPPLVGQTKDFIPTKPAGPRLAPLHNNAPMLDVGVNPGQYM